MRAGPFSNRKGGSSIAASLRRGLGFLALGSPQGASAFLAALPLGHPAYLRITARAVALADESSTLLRATTAAGGIGTFDPRRLSDLEAAADGFLDEHPGGYVVLDCLDLLVRHLGIERVVRAVEDHHDQVATRGAVLIVFLDVRDARPRLRAWLERELDVLRIATEPLREARPMAA